MMLNTGGCQDMRRLLRLYLTHVVACKPRSIGIDETLGNHKNALNYPLKSLG